MSLSVLIESLTYFVVEMLLAGFFFKTAAFYQPFRKEDSLFATSSLIVGAVGSLLANIFSLNFLLTSQDPTGYGDSLFSPFVSVAFLAYADIFLRQTSWARLYISCPLFNVDNETLSVHSLLADQKAQEAHDRWIDEQRRTGLQPKIRQLQKLKDKKESKHP